VVIGGTADVLLGLRHGLRHASARQETPDGGSRFTRARLDGWLRRMTALSVVARTGRGISPAYADIIPAGGAILLTLLETWGLGAFHTTRRNILDAFLLRSLSQQ
jgi:exopolyphosphatase/pppGpp-phosphohydrolase